MKISMIGTFDSTTTKSSGIAVMKLKFPYSEIANYSKLLMLLGKNLKAMMETEDKEKVRLGTVAIKQINIGREGEAKLTIEGIAQEMDFQNIFSVLERVVTFKVKDVEDDGE